MAALETVHLDELRLTAVETTRAMFRDLSYADPDLDDAPKSTVAAALQASATVFAALLDAAVQAGRPIELPDGDDPAGIRTWFLRKDAE